MKYYKDRLKICNSCEEKKKSNYGDKCGLCGCIIKIKALYKLSKCPAKKWKE